jgi:hypothetical protein
MANPNYRVVLAAVALCMLPACKSQRKVTWEKGSGGDRLTERFVGQSVERWDSGEQHEMDRKRTSPEKVFGGKHENAAFGRDGKYGAKKFGGTRNYAGKKGYNPDSYQFVRDREMAREAAAGAGKKYGDGGQKANDGRKKWFGRDKSVASETAYGSDKSVERSPFGTAQKAQGEKRESSIEILNPRGTNSSPKELSIGEVKKMLTR